MDFEDDELPPLPRMPPQSSPKRVRRRTRFQKDAAVVSAPVSSPIDVSPDQVISTLINSLTAISQDARDQLRREFQSDILPPLRHESDSEPPRPLSQDSFYVDIPGQRLPDPANYDYYDSDEDVAAAPIIRFTRPPIERKQKKKDKGKTSLYLNAMGSDTNLSVRTFQSAHSEGVPESMGIPSISRGNGSSTSLAGSIRSARTLTKTEQQSPKDQILSHLLPSRRSSASTARNVGSRDRYSLEGETKENANLSLDTETTKHPDSSPRASHEITNHSPLNALVGQGELRNNLIPSRRSSRRGSSQSDSPEQRRHSVSESRDLKDLNIDVDLIGSDDSTVRRIRELQEAREKRQTEWRKESRRSLDRHDRTGKRHLAPSPKAIHSRTSTLQGSKLSVTEVLVESEHETAPDLSARIDASDLAEMPALVVPTTVEEPLTPPAASAEPKQFPRSPQSTHSATTRAASSHVRGSPSSSSVKRSSTVSSRKRDSTLQGDVKSVQEDVEKFLAAPRLTQKIRHPRTGRTIAFSEVGDPDGFAVICCVGMGLTRYVMTFYDELARTLKLRLITPDRPGVGGSEGVSDRLQNPLTWVDDVAVICSCLDITRFSILAHSAGSIYALATALKMPQYVRGRIHLLAPWIPPSQMPKGAAIGPDSQPVANLPMSHRILSVLPTQFLKVANSKYFSATSASVESKSLKGKKLSPLAGLENLNLDRSFTQSLTDLNDPSLKGVLGNSAGNDSFPKSSTPNRQGVSCYQANNDTLGLPTSPTASKHTSSPSILESSPAVRLSPEARASLYNSALTHRIWTLATLNANPAIDLLVCLERRKTIGFRYAEVTRSVVIRHGAKDGRVPLDNARWLQSIMKRCELRVLEDEGHSLMASASVMSSVLTEIAKEWDEWQRIAKDKDKKKKSDVQSTPGKDRSMSLRSMGTISVKS